MSILFKGNNPTFQSILLTSLFHYISTSHSPVNTSPGVWTRDVHACPLGFIQVNTGTGCRRRPVAPLDLRPYTPGYRVKETVGVRTRTLPPYVQTLPS